MQKLTYAKIICILAIVALLFFKYSSNSWVVEKLNINNAWKVSKGENQVIAFVDTGIAKELYEKCSGRIVYPHNVLNNTSDVLDHVGHGTEMISAACSSGEYGVVGVAPNSKIMPIVAVDNKGYSSPENISEGIKWAIQHNATVINLSLGSQNDSDIVKKYIDIALKKNIIVVASAGDYGDGHLIFPASLSNVISVAAEDEDGKRISLSNYSSNCSITAPGDNVPVLKIDSNGNIVKGVSTGTSVSSAVVSGLIALGLSSNSNISESKLVSELNKSKNSKNFIDSFKFVKSLSNVN